MDWEIRLIAMFLFISQAFKDKLQFYCKRMSNNSSPKFTDEEVVVVFIWGIIQNRNNLKEISRDAKVF